MACCGLETVENVYMIVAGSSEMQSTVDGEDVAQGGVVEHVSLEGSGSKQLVRTLCSVIPTEFVRSMYGIRSMYCIYIHACTASTWRGLGVRSSEPAEQGPTVD